MTTREDLFQARFGLNPTHDGELDTGGGLARLLGRRVCRQYLEREVDEGLLETVLACAQSAPAKSDLQQYAIIIATHAQRDRVAELIPEMPWIGDADRFLLFCADMRRGRRIAAIKGLEYVNNTLDTFMNASVDAGLAMMQTINAAQAAGLGTCPVSAVRAVINEVIPLFGLPEGVFPLAGLALGWPGGEGRMSMRLPPAVVVHRETYDDRDLEDELAGYDARRNAVSPIPPEKQMHKDDFGISQTYGWTENTARRLAKRERADFGQVIRSHGFDLE